MKLLKSLLGLIGTKCPLCFKKDEINELYRSNHSVDSEKRKNELKCV